MSSSTDWNYINQLAIKSLNGDKYSYRTFLNLLSTYLKSKIIRTIPDNYIDDVLQETLLAIHKSLKTLDTNRSCRPWINAIAHYKVNDCLRGIYKDSNNNYEKIDQLFNEEIDSTEIKQYLEYITTPLNSSEKRILILLKYEGHSVIEVSNLTGNTVSNTKVISFRAMKKIRDFVSEKEFHERE